MYTFIAAKFNKENTVKTEIKVKFSVPGYHCWPSAPEAVAFLRASHRHDFFYTVTLEVYHHDREVEFFLLQTELRTRVLGGYPMGAAGALDFGSSSCEQLAQEIVAYIMEHYPGRDGSVEVSEDETNSSIATFTAEG